MSTKSRGITAERDLVHRFWAAGWAAIRVAGSGSSRYASPDVMAGNATRRVAIECKITKDGVKYFPKEDIEALKMFARVFGMESWVAVRFKGSPWAFFTLEDLTETEKAFKVRKEDSLLKGFSFEEFAKG